MEVGKKSQNEMSGISGPSDVGSLVTAEGRKDRSKTKTKTNINSIHHLPCRLLSPPILIAADFSLHEALYAA